MKLRVVILIVLTLTTVSTAYVSGRWNWFVIIPPVIIPACLMLITSLLVICPRHGDASAWNQRLVRFSALALCWLVALLPSLMGDGYFEMGRRAHIRSLFSPELVAEVRAAASKLSTKKQSLAVLGFQMVICLKLSVIAHGGFLATHLAPSTPKVSFLLFF